MQAAGTETEAENVSSEQGGPLLILSPDRPKLSDLLAAEGERSVLDIFSNVAISPNDGKRLHVTALGCEAGTSLLAEHWRPVLSCDFSDNMLLRHGARLASHMLETTRKSIGLHGNLHFGNIAYFGKHGWLALPSRTLEGDPHFDLAGALHHPQSWPRAHGGRACLHEAHATIRRRADRLIERTGLNRDRLLTFAFIEACNNLVLARHNSALQAGFYDDISIYLLDSLVD